MTSPPPSTATGSISPHRPSTTFVWNEYCDWYLELSKPVLWDENGDPEVQKGTRRTLVRVLEATLRLAHPMLPFITEEIWQTIAPYAGVELKAEGDTIMLQPFPVADQSKIDSDALADIEWLKTVIVGVRNIRGEMNISPAKALPIYMTKGGSDDQRRMEDNRQFLSKLANLESITWLNNPEDAPTERHRTGRRPRNTRAHGRSD